MKSYLEFELPADEEQFNTASKAMDWALIVWDIEQQCRDWIKYNNHDFKSIDDALQGIRDILNETMAEKGVRFPS